ncbi:hypothetical protein AB2B38_003350 [Balneola sp. MJW-20]|uniref:hypothetical protein n=1 Tax=Gracilimonas aurantiaca TaxID=3234185 RepID=UPI0034672F14
MTYQKSTLLLLFVILTSCTAGEKKIVPTQTSGLFSVIPVEDQQAFIECGINGTLFNDLIKLSYRDFDQDFSGGWRAISENDGCENTALSLIEYYIIFHKHTSLNQLKTLRWHAGQLAANIGNYPYAVALFETNLIADEAALTDDEWLWQLYVKGSISFLKRDLNSLQEVRDQLAAIPVSEEEQEARRKFLRDNPSISMPDGFVESPQNLNVLDRLIECFDSNYEVAYQGDCR